VSGGGPSLDEDEEEDEVSTGGGPSLDEDDDDVSTGGGPSLEDDDSSGSLVALLVKKLSDMSDPRCCPQSLKPTSNYPDNNQPTTHTMNSSSQLGRTYRVPQKTRFRKLARKESRENPECAGICLVLRLRKMGMEAGKSALSLPVASIVVIPMRNPVDAINTQRACRARLSCCRLTERWPRRRR